MQNWYAVSHDLASHGHLTRCGASESQGTTETGAMSATCRYRSSWSRPQGLSRSSPQADSERIFFPAAINRACGRVGPPTGKEQFMLGEQLKRTRISCALEAFELVKVGSGTCDQPRAYSRESPQNSQNHTFNHRHENGLPEHQIRHCVHVCIYLGIRLRLAGDQHSFGQPGQQLHP
jgi:hypothetical protein